MREPMTIRTATVTSFGVVEAQVASHVTTPFWDLSARVEDAEYLNQSTASCSAPAGNTVMVMAV